MPYSVSSTRASRCSVRSASSASFLDRATTVIRAVRDFCKTRGLRLGRLADRRFEARASRSNRRSAGSEARAELHEQALDGTAEIVARLARRRARPTASAAGAAAVLARLARPFASMHSAYQVFSQGDADISQSGGGCVEPFGRAAVLGLIGGAAAELGFGNRPCSSAGCSSRRVSSSRNRPECLSSVATACA